MLSQSAGSHDDRELRIFVKCYVVHLEITPLFYDIS